MYDTIRKMFLFVACKAFAIIVGVHDFIFEKSLKQVRFSFDVHFYGLQFQEFVTNTR